MITNIVTTPLVQPVTVYATDKIASINIDQYINKMEHFTHLVAFELNGRLNYIIGNLETAEWLKECQKL